MSHWSIQSTTRALCAISLRSLSRSADESSMAISLCNSFSILRAASMSLTSKRLEAPAAAFNASRVTASNDAIASAILVRPCASWRSRTPSSFWSVTRTESILSTMALLPCAMASADTMAAMRSVSAIVSFLIIVTSLLVARQMRVTRPRLLRCQSLPRQEQHRRQGCCA